MWEIHFWYDLVSTVLQVCAGVPNDVTRLFSQATNANSLIFKSTPEPPVSEASMRFNSGGTKMLLRPQKDNTVHD